MAAMDSNDNSAQNAQDALDALFATRLKVRENDSEPIFDLKEVTSDDRPVLIQCCIR